MNYYEHHIRDYDAATSHLTWDEDLAYTRLIRWYYRKEKPIPADVKEACRQVRASTKVQRDAVAAVLSEFFVLQADGWHNETCDQALTRYKDGEPEREVKKANEENRTKRHREERARLFKLLTDAGQHAPWNIGMTELRDLVSRLPATPTVTEPVTAPATPVTATQSPITNHQSPDKESNTSSQASSAVGDDDLIPGEPEPEPTHTEHNLPLGRNVQIALLLRAQLVNVTSQNPIVAVTWAQNPKVTDEVLNVAITKARAAKPAPEEIPVKYLARIVEQELVRQSEPPPEAKPREDNSWAASDSGITAKARELKIRVLPMHNYADVKRMCFDEIRKRKGA